MFHVVGRFSSSIQQTSDSYIDQNQTSPSFPDWCHASHRGLVVTLYGATLCVCICFCHLLDTLGDVYVCVSH